MTQWVASKFVKRNCMNFPTALASLPFSLYNRSLLYAWNLLATNTSCLYFLSKAGRLASIFSSFIVHNGCCQASLVNTKPCHKLVDKVKCRSIGVLQVVRKNQRASIELDWPILERLIDHFLKNPLDHKIHHFFLTAWIWLICDDQSMIYPK